MALTDYIEAQCDAIRTKDGTSSPIPFVDMANRILAIPTGGGVEPTLGFLPTEWDSSGFITKGKWYGGGSVPAYQFANVDNLGNGAYGQLVSVDGLEAVTDIGDRIFQYCVSLQYADLPLISRIGAYAFRNCADLSAIILRSATMVTLANANAFTGSSIANGSGYVYVPRALVSSYQSATNWSTYSAQIRAIEDYPEVTG